MFLCVWKSPYLNMNLNISTTIVKNVFSSILKCLCDNHDVDELASKNEYEFRVKNF